MNRYKIVAQHCINHEQVERRKIFLVRSDKSAKETFRLATENNSEIHEAQLFAVRGNRLVTDRVKYI